MMDISILSSEREMGGRGVGGNIPSPTRGVKSTTPPRYKCPSKFDNLLKADVTVELEMCGDIIGRPCKSGFVNLLVKPCNTMNLSKDD